MKSNLQKLSMITLGTVLMAIGTTLFFAPHQIAAGGVFGIGIIVNYLVPSISMSTVILIGNIILFVIGFLMLGKQFGVLTLYGSMLYALCSMVLEHVFPLSRPIVNDQYVCIIVGSAICSYGLYFVLIENASTGGTDIVTKILNKYLHIELSSALLIADGSVVLLSAFVISLDKALLAFVTVYVSSILLERVVTGGNRRIVMTIHSTKIDDINDYINLKLKRGSTIYTATGGYSKRVVRILVTVVHRSEYIRIKDFVDQIDPKAFVYVSYSSEVLGEGFTYPKTIAEYREMLEKEKQLEREFENELN